MASSKSQELVCLILVQLTNQFGGFLRQFRSACTMPLPEPVDGIIRKSELKLLGVTVNEDPCNWDVQFENMLSKASSRLYILRVWKHYGFSLQELTLQFDSLIMSLFTYAIEVWVSAHYCKYLSHIDKFRKRALRYGYTSKYTPIMDVIKMKGRLLWEENL